MHSFDTSPSGLGSRPPRSRLATILPWGATALAVGLATAFYWTQYRPLVRAHGSLVERFNQTSATHQSLTQQHAKLRATQTVLATEKRELQEELERTAAEREAALLELQKMQDELSSKLEAEIAEGNVLVQQRDGDLVVDVADKILFAKGEADVSERGRDLLAEVAETLRGLDAYVLSVGGHTDSAPITSPKVKERYPTNWELSTARATHVVRFLQDEGRIPGDRLVASGFAEFRPTANNRTPRGRQRNRRIEIVLLRKPATSAERE